MEGADGGAAGLRSSELFSLISLRVCWEKLDFDLDFPRSGSLKVGLVLLEMSDEPGEKGCTGCDRTLPVSHFRADSSKPSGLDSRCKDCKSDYQRLHYQERLDRRMGIPCDESRAYHPYSVHEVAMENIQLHTRSLSSITPPNPTRKKDPRQLSQLSLGVGFCRQHGAKRPFQSS